MAREDHYSGPRWIAAPRGTYHLAVEGPSGSLCGKLISPAREAFYSHMRCKRCEAKATPEQLAAADARRHELWDAAEAERERRLERNRSGVFTVIRCTKCGAQRRDMDHNYMCHSGRRVGVCDLGAIEVQGPAWSEPEWMREVA